MNIKKPIYVTQPHLPPLEEFVPYLETIWNNKILTNNGPFHSELEKKLCEFLGVPYISLFSNGTIALITALKALDIKGEVITTPYSFVATTHAAVWNGIDPVFVDVDLRTANIDPLKIESAITEKTSAILAVHCYGNACNIEKIQKIAKKHKLRVIYDAAHAFGISDKEGSILRHGDLSVLSFHATKVFNTFEGGAIICNDENTKRRLDNLKNFGFVDETTVIDVGINGKLSEINSAFGLLQLKHINKVLNQRKKIDETYKKSLLGIDGLKLLVPENWQTHNYSYFPIIINEKYGMTRDALYEKLRNNNIFARRYFYPLISDFPSYKHLKSACRDCLPNARKLADSVLCLPIYPDLSNADQLQIIKIIRGV